MKKLILIALMLVPMVVLAQGADLQLDTGAAKDAGAGSAAVDDIDAGGFIADRTDEQPAGAADQDAANNREAAQPAGEDERAAKADEQAMGSDKQGGDEPVIVEPSQADADDGIDYPIAQLGDCDSPEACQTYCENPDNFDACLQYGLDQGMYPKEQEKMAQDVLNGNGPNDCQGSQCIDTCSDTANGQQCVAFAYERGAMSDAERQGAEAVLDGGGPGGCTQKDGCQAYCENPINGQECVEFAVAEGLMSEQDVGRVEQLRNEGGPGGCQGERQCQAYCAEPQNEQDCLQFAVDHGLDVVVVDEVQRQSAAGEQIERSDQVNTTTDAAAQTSASSEPVMVLDDETGLMVEVQLQELIDAVTDFTGPSGCTGTLGECRDFCDQSENAEECRPYAG